MYVCMCVVVFDLAFAAQNTLGLHFKAAADDVFVCEFQLLLAPDHDALITALLRALRACLMCVLFIFFDCLTVSLKCLRSV